MQTIDGVINKVMFHKPSKWSPAGVPFLIGKLHNGTTIKGEMRKPLVGERYRFFGEYRPDKKYPDQESFDFAAHEILIDQTTDGVTQYLAAHVGGVGRAKASLIVEHFGNDTLKILRTEPQRVAEVVGISESVVNSLVKHFEDDIKIDPAAYARLVELFKDYTVPKKVLKRLLEDWGSDAPGMVVDNPYRLLSYPRMSWENVDSFATTRAGYDAGGLERHKAAIIEAIERIANDGHTIVGKIDVEEIAFKLIAARPVTQAWAELVEARKIVRVAGGSSGNSTAHQDEMYALAKLHAAECEIARRIADIAAAAKPLAIDHRIEGLNEDQQAAVKVIVENGVAVLAGAPGVGKSFTVALLLKAIVEAGLFGNIKVTAPTGKAAKRAAELLASPFSLGNLAASIPCTTIHRALGPTPSDGPEGVPSSGAKVGRGRDEFGFTHNEGNPLDCDYLVVDEASMLDASLAASLLRAIALGTRLLFVGDPNQLPSVGPGAILRDIIASGVPTATLTKIVRSDGGGRVVRACHAIMAGETPQPGDSLGLPTENWIHREASDPHEIARIIVELHAKIQAGSKLGLDPVWDMQVVSAQKGKHAFGCENLNQLLSAQLNPPKFTDGSFALGDDTRELPFRPGDKVVRRKNGLVDEMIAVKPEDKDKRADWTWDEPAPTLIGQWVAPGSNDDLTDLDGFAAPSRWTFRETMVVNGDMGTVLDVVIGDRDIWVVVRFRTPDRLCRISLGECHLERAYAVTVHTSQGSGFPYVIVPVHPSFYWDSRKETGLWCRELFYTAISRAERILVTVGPREAIRLAIGRKTIHQRQTQLLDRIIEAREAKAVEAKSMTAGPDEVAQSEGVAVDLDLNLDLDMDTSSDDLSAIERWTL